MPSNNFMKIHNGINFYPQSSTPTGSSNGDFFYNSSTNVFQGYISSGFVNFVGDTLTQTLTNKTISGSSNTFSNIADSALSSSYLFANGSRSLTGPLTATQQTTPANPSSGSNKLYFKSDNNLYILSSSGSEVAISNISGSYLPLTGGTLSGPFTVDGNGSTAGFSVSSANLVTIGASSSSSAQIINGGLTINGTSSSSTPVVLQGTTTSTSGSIFAINSTLTLNSNQGNTGVGFYTQLTSAASTAMSAVVGYESDGVIVGSSGSVGRFVGFLYGTGHLNATNSAALADTTSFLSNYFIYQSGTTASAFGGAMTFGTSGSTNANIAYGTWAFGGSSENSIININHSSSSNPLTGATQRGYLSDFTSTSAATSNVFGFQSSNTTAPSTTVAFAAAFNAPGIGKGSGGTITREVSFYSPISSSNATNFAMMADNSSFTGNWFINQSGTTASSLGGSLTAASFSPTSSTAPTNGMYLSGTNTLNFSTNTTNRIQIDSAGRIGLGNGNPGVNVMVNLTGTHPSTAVANWGYIINFKASTSATTAVYGISSGLTTAGSSTTLGLLANFESNSPTVVSGDTVTQWTDILIANPGTLTGVTYRQFLTDTTPLPGNYGIYLTSTFANVFGGTVTGASFIPTSSTAPTNGLYLIASNQLGFSANSTNIGSASTSAWTLATNQIAIGSGASASAPFIAVNGQNNGSLGLSGASGTSAGGVITLYGNTNSGSPNVTQFNNAGNVSAVIDANNNLNLHAGFATLNYQTAAPSSGGTVTCSANLPGLLLTQTGTLTTLTIKLPSSPLDGMQYWVASVGSVTTTTWQDAGGTAGNVIGGPSNLGAGTGGYRFVYSSSQAKWFKI